MNARKIPLTPSDSDIHADVVVRKSFISRLDSFFQNITYRLRNLFSTESDVSFGTIFNEDVDEEKVLLFMKCYIPLIINKKYQYAALYQFFYFQGWISESCTVKSFCAYVQRSVPATMMPLTSNHKKVISCNYDSVIDYAFPVPSLVEWNKEMSNELHLQAAKHRRKKNLSSRAIDSIAAKVEDLEVAWAAYDV